MSSHSMESQTDEGEWTDATESDGANSTKSTTGESSSQVQSTSAVPIDSSASASASASSTAIQRQPSTQQRQCWVCFATDEDDPDPAWVRPCRCRGSTMWVHQKCLQRWVDEKQRGNTFAAVACGSCGFVYTIIYPRANFAVLILEKLDRLVAKVCPLMTGGIIIVSLYWSAVTYGAVTVMQIMGSDRGMQALEKADPIFLLVGLPAIPIMLVSVKMIRWEDKIVGVLRDRFINRPNAPRNLAVPDEGAAAAAIGGGGGGGGGGARDPAAQAQQQIIRDAASATRVLCGALALPTIAVTIGKLIFGESVAPPLRRACYGAAIFIAVRGATKIYYKYQQIVRQKNRSIVDYTPTMDRQAQPPNQHQHQQAENGNQADELVDNDGPDVPADDLQL